MSIVVAVAVVLAVLGVQRAWAGWTDRSSRPRHRAAEAGFRWAGPVEAVGRVQEGALATSAEPQPPAADAPPLIVAERADPLGRSVVAVGPGKSGPIAGSLGATGDPGLRAPSDGHPSERSPSEVIGQISARRAEKEAVPSGSPAWQAADLDEHDLVEALARAVGRNITPDGLEWLIRRQQPGVATAVASPTPPVPTSPSPDALDPNNSAPPTPLLAPPGASGDRHPSAKRGHTKP